MSQENCSAEENDEHYLQKVEGARPLHRCDLVGGKSTNALIGQCCRTRGEEADVGANNRREKAKDTRWAVTVLTLPSVFFCRTGKRERCCGCNQADCRPRSNESLVCLQEKKCVVIFTLTKRPLTIDLWKHCNLIEPSFDWLAHTLEDQVKKRKVLVLSCQLVFTFKNKILL